MSGSFNEVEMMILSKLSYYKAPGVYNSDGSAVAPCTLYEMLDAHKSELYKEFDDKSVSDFINKAKNQNYTVVKAVDNTYVSGFEAIAVQGPDSKTVTVAARGSEGLKDGRISNVEDAVQDWVCADFLGLGLQSESQQHKDMAGFMDDLDGYDSIYLTGHSLGGNLAVAGAVSVEDSSKIKGVYTYNSPGQNVAYWEKHKYKISQIKGKVTNYQTEGDVVSDINSPIGDVVVIKSKEKGSSHSLSDFTTDGKNLIESQSGKFFGHDVFSFVADGCTAWGSLYMMFSMSPTIRGLIGNEKIYDKINDKCSNFVNIINSRDDFIFINTDGLYDIAKNMKLYQQEYISVMQKMTNLIISLQQEHVWDTTATTCFISSYIELKRSFDKFGETIVDYAVILEKISEKMAAADRLCASNFSNISM